MLYQSQLTVLALLIYMLININLLLSWHHITDVLQKPFAGCFCLWISYAQKLGLVTAELRNMHHYHFVKFGQKTILSI